MEPEQTNIETPAPRYYKPRALLFWMLSILWVFPSIGAFWILFRQPEWKSGGFGAVTIEQWVAVAVLVAHVHFVWLAWLFRRTEKEVLVDMSDELETEERAERD